MCITKKQSCKTFKTKIDLPERRSREIHIYSWRFQHPLSITFRTTRQKTSKVIEELKSGINQKYLIDIYRTFHLRIEEYILFINIQGTYTNIDHILFNKTNFNNFKRVEIMQSMSSDHNGINPEIVEKDNRKIPKY